MPKEKISDIKKDENLILLITTKGCEGCSIMNNVILKSLDQLTTNIKYVTTDVTECDKKLLMEHKVTDFPTTLFFRNGIFVDKFVGTKSVFKTILTLTKHFN